MALIGDHGERDVWHGTSSLDPSVIYDDQQDGFMMQFAARGFWGRGLYYAGTGFAVALRVFSLWNDVC